MALDSSKEDILEAALKIENVERSISGLEIVKTIVVPNKLVNLVVK